MAKTSGPLFSVDAHGSLSGILTFSHRRSGSQVRAHNKPRGIPSHAQRSQRRLTEFLVAQWQGMTLADRDVWRARALAGGTTLSGYHYFLAQAHRDLLAHTGLICYLPMNHISSGKCLDLSGNGLDLVLGSAYPTNAPAMVASKNTRYYKALSYTSNGQLSYIPHSDLFNRGEGDFTACVSINAATMAQYGTVFWMGNPVNMRPSLIFMAWGTSQMTIVTADGSSISSFISFVIDKNKWLDFVIFRKAGQVSAFMNGVVVRWPYWMTNNFDSAYDFYIGSCPTEPTRTWDGLIDEFCFYDRAMPVAEVKARARFNGKI